MSGDWRIYIEPRGEGRRETLEVLSGDPADAVDALDGWADSIRRYGFVPDGLDVLSRPGAAITRERSARGLSYGIRCDSFERETENGTTTSGAGYLRAEEVPGE